MKDCFPAIADNRRNGKFLAMRLVRLLTLLAVFQLAGACSNRVLSEQPWFDASAASESVYRDGIWLYDDPECKVREAKPTEAWPDCANWAYRRGNQMLTPQWSETCEGKLCDRTYDEWSVKEQLTAAGDPMISQSQGCRTSRREDAVSEDAVAQNAIVPTQENATPSKLYCYDAVRPLSRDGQGKIVSAETWPVLCGPWPAEDSKPNVTDRPWPGVTIVEEDCRVAGEAVLRNAAKLSHEEAKKVGLVVRVRWIRDGYR